MGSSPRGALAMCRMAKACAYISGRDYVVPEDVAAVAPDVLSHRLILNSRARFNETAAYDIVKEILAQAKMPVLREPA
jgi:MoxR-like ATPase